MTLRLGERRAIQAVVLAGTLVTYGGVSLFRILGAPMAQALFRVDLPRRRMPAAIAPGTSTFTMSALRPTPFAAQRQTLRGLSRTTISDPDRAIADRHLSRKSYQPIS
jgi:H+/gluconate symporter-like permease